MTKIILAITILIFFSLALAKLFRTRKKVEKEEEKMKSELKALRYELKNNSELFDIVSGYNKFMKELEKSINWLDNSKHFKLQFEKFKAEFKRSAQVEHKNFLVSCLTLYPNPYFIPKEKYFGKFAEANYAYV